jgi:hypothetical protein
MRVSHEIRSLKSNSDFDCEAAEEVEDFRRKQPLKVRGKGRVWMEHSAEELPTSFELSLRGVRAVVRFFWPAHCGLALVAGELQLGCHDDIFIVTTDDRLKPTSIATSAERKGTRFGTSLFFVPIA